MLAIQVNHDLRLALSFLVLLNINLAILNLLPVPVLDGGHILLSIIEWIRKAGQCEGPGMGHHGVCSVVALFLCVRNFCGRETRTVAARYLQSRH